MNIEGLNNKIGARPIGVRPTSGGCVATIARPDARPIINKINAGPTGSQAGVITDSDVLRDLDPIANHMAGTVITGVNNFNTKRVKDSKVTWDISKSVAKCGGTIVTSLVICGGAKLATDAHTPVAFSISSKANSSRDTTLKHVTGNSIASDEQPPERLKRTRFS